MPVDKYGCHPGVSGVEGGGCTATSVWVSVSARYLRIAVGCSVPPGSQPGEARAGLCVQYF